MFALSDFMSMTDYFKFINVVENNKIEVMSKNTKHCWYIVHEDNHYTLFHKHAIHEPYHIHGQFEEILDCVLEIVNHDEWKLNIWRYKHVGKWRQPKTYFDRILEQYIKHSQCN